MSERRARSTEPEWMDAADLPAPALRACLRELSAVNTATLGRLPTLGFMARAVRRGGGRLHVLDVGCGDGDMLRRLARWGARRGLSLRLEGVDLNPACIDAARAATPPALGIVYRCADVLEAPIEADVILSALMAHHLDDASVAAFLRRMDDHARVGWFVNDLQRHVLALHAFRALAAAASWGPIVRHDGAISVTRGFHAAEWRALLARAGIEGAELRWHIPFRWCVGRFT